MTPTRLHLRPHTDAVLAKLRGTGFAVGDSARSDGEDGKGVLLDPPCMVLYFVPGGDRYGTLDDWTRHADLIYQVTCIGRTRGECEAVRDASEVLLEGLEVPGRRIGPVFPRNEGDEARKDDTVGDPRFILTPQYRFRSSPFT